MPRSTKNKYVVPAQYNEDLSVWQRIAESLGLTIAGFEGTDMCDFVDKGGNPALVVESAAGREALERALSIKSGITTPQAPFKAEPDTKPSKAA